MSVLPVAQRDDAPSLTKAERAYFELRRSIANGTIRPGTVFNQEQLARDLEMSTTPLRETLRRLATEGFVELSPHRDVRVPSLTVDEMRKLYEVRLALEPHAARSAAFAATDDDIAAVEREIDRSPDQISNLPEYYQQVHQLLYAGCDNVFLVSLLDRINDRLGRYRAMLLPLDAGMAELVERFHKRAREAFIARDGDQLEAVVREYLAHAVVEFTERVRARFDADAADELPVEGRR